ncbi:hypothetical protein [Oceanicola sp. S124]|uniref:hypothetical protein n=1 Tax=Oceanicola sp. S124 TaxID=1042378 RepID=UPI001ED8CAD7|nr:hypothetical protein [Oceanicola sp. S124]
MAAFAFASNEGKDDEGNDLESSEYGATLAVNVAVMNITANAEIESGTTLRAQDTVTVNAASENSFDPTATWLTTLISPLIEAFSDPDYTPADGEVDISAGDIVKDDDGTYYKAKTTKLKVDLATEDFAGEPADWEAVDWSSYVIGFIGELATYLDDNFGLVTKLFNIWEQSFARGEKASIALAGHYLDTNYNAYARVHDGAKVVITTDGTDAAAATDGASLDVSASATDQNIIGVGNIAPFGMNYSNPASYKDKGFGGAIKAHYSGVKKSFKDSKVVQNPLGEGETETAIGGSIGINLEQTGAIAEVGDIWLKADDMNVTAGTHHLGVSVVAAGGKGGKLSINGAWNHYSIDTTARAEIGAGSTITLSGDLTVNATEIVSLFAFAGGVSVSDGTSVGLSGVTVLSDRTARAQVAGDGSGGTFDITGNASFDAASKGVILLGAVAAAVASDPPPTDQADTGGSTDTSSLASSSGSLSGIASSGASGASASSKGGVAVSGSATALQETVNVHATVSDLASFEAGELSLSAKDQSTKVLIAGAGAVSTTSSGQSTVGVSGAVTVVNSEKNISSKITTASNEFTLALDKLTLSALDESGYYLFAAGVAVATGNRGTAVTGSLTVAVNRTEIEAGLSGTSSHQVTLAGTPEVEITAKNTADWISVAGAAAYGGKTGVGVALGFSVVESLVTVLAEYVGHATGVSADGFTLSALNDIVLDAVAFGIAGSSDSAGGAGVGMVALNHYSSSTVAEVTNSDIKVGNSGGLTISALETSWLGVGAGGAALSAGNAAVGIAVAVNIVTSAKNDDDETRGTEVLISGSTLTTGTTPMVLLAGNDMDMVAVAVGAAVSKKVALAGSAAANRSFLGAKVLVDGTSTLTAGGTLRAEAYDEGTYVAVGGGFGLALTGSGGGAGGAGIALNLIDTPLTVKIDGVIEATGATSLIARSEQGLVTVALGGAGSGGISVGGSVATSTLAGDVKVEIASSGTWTVGDLTATATDSSYITNIAGAVGISLGNGGVGLAFGVIDNRRSITSKITGATTINASGHMTVAAGARAPVGGGDDYGFLDDAVAGLADDVFSQTDIDRDDLKSQSVNITAAVGGSKMVGVGFNLASTYIERDITAAIGDSAVITLTSSSTDIADATTGQTKGLQVTADDASGIVTVSVGAAAAIGMGSAVAIAVAGSVALAEIDSDVEASIGAATITLANQADLGVTASNDAGITSVAFGAAAAIGGTLGAGAVGFSAASNIITSVTGARLGANVTGTGGAAGINNLFLDVENSTRITSVSLAAAVAGTTGPVGFAGGGAGSGNTIKGATYALVDGASVSGVDDMSLDAYSDADITAVVVGLAVAVAAGGGAGGGVALGVAVAINQTDAPDSAVSGLPSDHGFIVAARVTDSILTLGGDVSIAAKSEIDIDAHVVAASVAVAATGGFGLAGAGAGAGAANLGQAEVLAEVSGSTSSHKLAADSVSVTALNLADIYSGVGSAAVAVSVAGGSAVAVSIAVAVARNEMEADTVARITGLTGTGLLDVENALSVEARTSSGGRKLEIEAIAVSASVSVAGSSAVGVAIAGAGAFAFNKITGSTLAEITDVNAGTAGSLLVSAVNEAVITASVVSVAVAIGVAGSGGGLGVSIGATHVSNRIGTSDDAFDVTARIRDAGLSMTGASTISATNSATITALGNANSVAVGVDSFAAGAASGAGAGVNNEIYTATLVEIERTAAYGDSSKFLETETLTLIASDTSSSTATAVGAALAAAVAPIGVGVAISIGAAIARNDLKTSAQILITDNALTSAPMIQAGVDSDGDGADTAQGRISATATNDATAKAYSVAASVAAGGGIFGGLALSGAGANSTNVIKNTSEIVITDARIRTSGTSDGDETIGDMSFVATSTTHSTSAVTSAAVAASAGIVAGAGSIGISISKSQVGGDSEADRAQVTRVYATGSYLDAADDLTLSASATEEHHLRVAAASVALAIGIGGGVAVAGLGINVTNHSTVEAIAEDSYLIAGGSITLQTTSSTTVDDTVDGVEGNTMVGTATSVGATAVSISVSLLNVDIGNASRAQVLGGVGSDTMVEAGGNVTVHAAATSIANDLNGVGVTLAGGGFTAAGGGLNIFLDTSNEVLAEIDLDSDQRQVEARSGTVEVRATETVEMSSNIDNVTVAASAVGLAIGAAVLESRHGSTVRTAIRNAKVTAQDIALWSRSDVDITKVGATGVSIGAVAAVVNVGRALAEGQVQAIIDNANLVAGNQITGLASYDMYLRSSNTGVAAGIGALGTSFAKASGGTGYDYDSQLMVINGSALQAETISLKAELISDIWATTTAGGGGGYVGTGAETTVTDAATADVRIDDGTSLTAEAVSIAARADREVDGAADAYSIAVASGSGASLLLTSTGDATVRFTQGTGAADDRTLIIARSVQVQSYNKLYKEGIVDTDGGGKKVENNVTTGAGNLVGLSYLGTVADIGTDSDKSVSQVDLGKTRIVGVGSYADPGSVTLRALSDHSVADAIEVHAVSGVAGAAVATSSQIIRAETDVSMDGASIENFSGEVTVETRAYMRNTADAAIFQAGYLSANLGISVTAKTFSDTTINVNDSVIQANRLALTAGKANGTVNTMVSRTAANGSLVSLGVSLGVAVQTNTTDLKSDVSITGSSQLLSAGNVFIEAEDGLSSFGYDGLVLVLAVPPYGYGVANQGSQSTSNTVDIAETAQVRAGVNFQSHYLVYDAADFQAKNPGMLSGGDAERSLTNAEKTALGLDLTQDYTIGFWDSAELSMDLFYGDVVQLTAASITAGATGASGGYYRFIGAESGGVVALNMNTADYTNTALWQRISSPSAQQIDAAYQSDAGGFMRDALEEQIIVVRPTAINAPTVSVGRLATLLASQYQKIQQLMSEYDTNEEALVRYQAQLEQIATQMQQLGLTPPDETGGVVEETLETLFITIPDITAAPGSIFIESDDGASAFSGLTSGGDPVLKAHKDVEIKVYSNMMLMHRVGDVIIDNTKVARYSEYTGDYTEFYPGNIYVNDVKLTGADDGTEPTATITVSVAAMNRGEYGYITAIQDYFDEQYSLGNFDQPQTVPTLPPDLYVLGSVVNELGNVTLNNDTAAIRITGQISGQTVNISAGGDFTITTDWYHVGSNPALYNGISGFVGNVEPAGSTKNTKVTDYVSDTHNTDVKATIDAAIAATAASSAVVANGMISIVATYVNVNGLIQSGVTEASITIDENFVAPTYDTSLSGEDGQAINGVTFGEINGTAVPVTGRWDSAEQAFILDDMVFSGGRVEITGNVISTGGGRIVVASGYANVSIRNNSGYKLIVNEIDTSTDRKGVIQITDTLQTGDHADSVARRTTYTESAGSVTRTESYGLISRDGEGNFQGVEFVELGTLSSNDTGSYAPVEGTYYIYSQGQRTVEQTIETRYEKTFNLFFNFDAGGGTLLSKNTETLDDAPLLESQALSSYADLIALGGWTQTPSASAGEYPDVLVRYKNVANYDVELVFDDVVRGPDGTYYRYNVADTLQIELSDLFESDNSMKAAYADAFEVTTSPTFTESDRDTGEYLSTFKNFDQTTRKWTEGGGYMKKKTVYNETTTVEGLKKYWDVAILADHQISIEFANLNATPEVRIESVGDVVIAGDIKTAPEAKVFLNPQFALPGGAVGVNGGSITAEDGVSVSGYLQSVDTDGSVTLTLVNFVTADAPAWSAGDSEAPDDARVLDIRATGDIKITVGSDSNDRGVARITNVISTGGDVVIRAPQGIYASSGSVIAGDRVELQSSSGLIGTAAQAVGIDTDHTDTDGGFAASAGLGMNITEIAGDLHLVQPKYIRTDFIRPDELGPISVGSLSGAVQITAAAGSIYDYNFETDGAITAARLEAYKARLGLTDGNRTVIGFQLDAALRADYADYVEYWTNIREELGAGAVSSDLTALSTYDDLVASLAASDPDIDTAEAEQIIFDTYNTLHQQYYDKPFFDTELYANYYAVIWVDGETVELSEMSSFKAEVASQLAQLAGAQINARYGTVHQLLASYATGTDSDLRDYVEQIHGDAASKTELTELASFQTYLEAEAGGAAAWALLNATDQQAAIDAATARFEDIHNAVWSFDHAVLTGYIDYVRAATTSEGAKDSEGAYLSAAEDMAEGGAVGSRASDYDAAIPGFDTAAEKAAFEAELTYLYEDLHEANKAREQKGTYVESLFLEGSAREAAIDAAQSQYGTIDSTLSSSVALELYPLLEISAVTGGAGAAAENANIIAEEVILTASGSADGQGQIGTLTEPVQIDFTLDLDSLSPAEKLAQENLRRSLQAQDIVDVVYDLYIRTGGDATLTAQPEQGGLAADTGNWTRLTVIFTDYDAAQTLSVADGEVIAVWNSWPVAGESDPAPTYRLFRNTSGSTAGVAVQSVNWDAPGAGWSEITSTKSFAEDPAFVNVTNGDIMADLWSVQRVSARPFADVNLRALTASAALLLTMNSSGLAGIGHDGATLNVKGANAGGFLRIVSTGSLYDVASGGYAATASDYVSLVADGSIGTSDSFFRVNITDGSTLMLQTGQDAFIEQKGGDLTVTRALIGGSLDLKTPADLRIGDIDVLGNAKLTVGGNLTDAAGDDADPSLDLNAVTVELDVTGNVGSTGNRIEIDLSGGIFGTVGGNLYLSDYDQFELEAGEDLAVTGTADIAVRQAISGAEGSTLSGNVIVLDSRFSYIGTQALPFDLLITGSGGHLSAEAVNTIWITSAGALPLMRLTSQELVTLSVAGAITNARSDSAATIVTTYARLQAESVGTASSALVTDVTRLALQTTSGGAWLHELNTLLIDSAYFDGLAIDLAGTGVITSAGAMTLSKEVDATGQSLTLGSDAQLELTGSDAKVTAATLEINAETALVLTGAASLSASNATLRAGDSLSFSLESEVTVTGLLALEGDGSRFASDGEGAAIEAFGTWDAATITLTTYGDEDSVLLQPTRIDGDVTVKLGGGEDLFTLTSLNARDAADSLLIDGEGAADEFIVNRPDAARSYVLDFVDSGGDSDGADILTINGRDTADTVLVRANFVALLNTDAEGAITEDVERINYTPSINGRIRINTLDGDDYIASDDTGTLFTLDGGAGDDTFQIGQLFGADRQAPHVAIGDEIDTVETTQGFLTPGNSQAMVIFGGTGHDTFNVYSNKALTKLFGESGNDTFVVRAFVLKADSALTAGGGDTEVFGGAGDDKVLYNINAPLSIDGGAGTDTIVVLGTEADDSFLITEGGIYGAGLNISFAGVEKAEVDGLEGDDTFYVLSTAEGMVVTVIGGLGSDTISVAGDVTNEIVSQEVEGTSSVINHSVLSADPAFNQIFVDGLRLNVASAESGLFEVDTSGLAVLDEGGTWGSYRIRMTEAVAGTVYLTVSAARSSTEDRELTDIDPALSALVATSATGDYASAQVIEFTNANEWVTVYVKAPQDGAAEGTRDVVISHAATGTGLTSTPKIANAEVTVYDDDKAMVLVEGNPSEVDLVEGGTGYALQIRLSRAPEPGETITVTPTFAGSDLELDIASVTFTDADWSDVKTIIVTAMDDSGEENTERHTLALEVSSTDPASAFLAVEQTEIDVTVADNDKGSVIITQTNGSTIVSEGATDSYTMVLSKAPTADVVVSILSDGLTLPSSTDPRFVDGKVTFTADNWDQPVTITLTKADVPPAEGQPTVAVEAQEQVLTGIRGPLYVYGGIGPGTDRALEQGLKLPTETDEPLPEVSSPVDEDTKTDTLLFFNAGALTNQSGTLTETRLTGFGMVATDLVLNEGTVAAPSYVTYDAGITYAEFEVVELMLGQGDDTLAIDSTAAGAITAIHGGGGSDTITVTAPASGEALAGGEDRVLAIFGDTTQSGDRYSTYTGAINGSGRAFIAGGNDSIDASAAMGTVIIYGGVGDDSITGSNYDDHLLGGSGNDTIAGLSGRDHIYGDNGLNIDLSLRNDLQDQLISVVSQQDTSADGYDAQTGDALAAAGDDVITSLGQSIILADFGVIEQLDGVNRAFDTRSIARVSSVRDDEGGADEITTGSGEDWIIAGAGGDTISSGTGADVVLGDAGSLTVHDGILPAVADSSDSAPEAGGADQITLGDGVKWVIGGQGGDTITGANGGGVVLGDNGRIAQTALGAYIRIETTDSLVGGADDIDFGSGDMVVMGWPRW